MIPPLQVLLVEDDFNVRLGCEQAMQLAGIPVTGVASAEEAERLLRPDFPGIVVTDMRLPGADGMTLLKRINALNANTDGLRRVPHPARTHLPGPPRPDTPLVCRQPVSFRQRPPAGRRATADSDRRHLHRPLATGAGADGNRHRLRHNRLPGDAGPARTVQSGGDHVDAAKEPC